MKYEDRESRNSFRGSFGFLEGGVYWFVRRLDGLMCPFLSSSVRHLEILAVILSAATGLSREADRSFAALRMTELDLAGGEELSRAFEPWLKMVEWRDKERVCTRMSDGSSRRGM